MTPVRIRVTELAVGMLISDGKRRITVKTIVPCTQTSGVPRIHVNGSLCYETIGYVEIIPERS